MTNAAMPRLKLRRLVTVLALASGIIAFVNTLYAAYLVQREQLIANTLEANRAYAIKQAEVTDLYIESIQRQLILAAERAPRLLGSKPAMEDELARLVHQTDGIMTAAIADKNGTILATAPADAGFDGRTLVRQPLATGAQRLKGQISTPYVGMEGQLILAFSEPFNDARGAHGGTIVTAIHLRQGNEFDKLVGDHFYRDGSYLYVVDGDGNIIYHKDKERIGTSERNNAVVEAVLRGETGAMPVVNTKGTHLLAGYAALKHGGWGVVAQRPLDETLYPLQSLTGRIVLYALPVGLIMFLVIYLLGRWISRPLEELAQVIERDQPGASIGELDQIKGWYYEAARLRNAVTMSQSSQTRRIDKLNTDTITDPMTGLINRRGLALQVATLRQTQQPFAALALDLDHFKRVNDTFGHAAGDQVLIALANILRACIRAEDAPCRVGGEEFLILMPHASRDTAEIAAERIRTATASHVMPQAVGHVTVSIGIALWPSDDPDIEKVLGKADQALYRAKNSGRNRVAAWSAAEITE
ncbi:diguanylate cyclase [Achromobacter pestifer]|uniref:diguanylate cyclase n=1 Tax=Achromobacter pestifer TaxID=1353889 RepID=A0A7D4HZB3_9BURK|nr:sensor domain-containing diguanylate cyclase [Achromobacter pestifer]QKH36500.1 diguanylate cyclase [Achromobacter pestifer]